MPHKSASAVMSMAIVLRRLLGCMTLLFKNNLQRRFGLEVVARSIVEVALSVNKF